MHIDGASCFRLVNIVLRKVSFSVEKMIHLSTIAYTFIYTCKKWKSLGGYLKWKVVMYNYSDDFSYRRDCGDRKYCEIVT